jgi:hypothetical protein
MSTYEALKGGVLAGGPYIPKPLIKRLEKKILDKLKLPDLGC